ncbi:MAG TPA: iron-containing alcohol dehydrogenase [Polyangiaceae bacterium]|jgi:alcohol dehydrogenase class IV|nr:MAG: 1,3-propanediol dehydrogenase [Deltaproteobacteria bacterium ADurb.Bin207]HNS97141.1 iron-containing alcohol dehydrogenase [Polyangiaceae bacterium]HNZ22194.1 iron-containing alcohol dehydrogenase [Polyangiaceae bacterium]HOD23963.1 iron-containing alcohol dehydrogenase [Polyangiaceae bacterium]HOE47018.1 iron-containing alcohol dehydrogenase [Polyangiaceae bacterium]
MLWTVKKGLYRTQQRVMKVAAKVLPFPVPALLTGPGSVRQLADNVSVRGLRHVLVVTDKGLMDIGLPASLFESLREKGITFAVFDEVQVNPTIENVEAGVRVYRQHGCDGIIAIGGGSPMDCAKIIGARVGNPFLSVRRMKGLFKVILPIPPLFCVPTTAGTGSETTVVGVITDASTHEKFAINDLKLVPKVAVLDPELMVGLPPAITAATGMDALTHAVEAYIGLNGNSFTDRHAEKATRLVFENLEKVYCDGSDLEARYQMALASTFAGAAFTRAYVGYVHAIAHNMGGLYGVAHGLANAIILPHVLTFCREQAAHKLAMLAMVAGLGARGEPDIELADRFIERIKQMNERMGIPTTIAELQAHDIPLIVRRTLAEAHPDYPVPRIMTYSECEKLVRQLLP